MENEESQARAVPPARALARQERLQVLEHVFLEWQEPYFKVGLALKEIKEDELYREAGCKDWTSYLRTRVAAVFGIEMDHAKRLILCARVREKLPPLASMMRTCITEGEGGKQERRPAAGRSGGVP